MPRRAAQPQDQEAQAALDDLATAIMRGALAEIEEEISTGAPATASAGACQIKKRTSHRKENGK